MTRFSSDTIDDAGTVRNGFDYQLQIRVENYICQPCAHPMYMSNNAKGVCCNQMKYAGQDIRMIPGKGTRIKEQTQTKGER